MWVVGAFCWIWLGLANPKLNPHILSKTFYLVAFYIIFWLGIAEVLW
jgi:hypothetical protein